MSPCAGNGSGASPNTMSRHDPGRGRSQALIAILTTAKGLVVELADQRAGSNSRHHVRAGTAGGDLVGGKLEGNADPLGRRSFSRVQPQDRRKGAEQWIPGDVSAAEKAADEPGSRSAAAEVDLGQASVRGGPDDLMRVNRLETEGAAHW